MVECGLPKPETRVRFPSPAPLRFRCSTGVFPPFRVVLDSSRQLARQRPAVYKGIAVLKHMTMQPVKFPLTVKVGSCQATVYKSVNKGYPTFTVVYYDASNVRQRPTFSTFETAKEEAERLMRGIAQGDSGAGILRDADRFAYTRALEILRPTGLALDLAVHHVAEAHKLLKGASVLDAVRYFALHNCQDRPVRTVAEVADELRANRQKGGASELYIRDLRIRLGRLATAFQCPIASLTRPDIEAHLNSLKVTPRTIHNHRTTIGTMLNFAVDQGYLPAGHPILGRATRCFKGQTKPEVFTPEEMEKLLKTAKPELVPALAIAGFAGVRAAEIKRLQWEDLKLDRGFIEISAAISKLKIRRRVPITANLRQWLLPYAKPSGKVVNYANLGNAWLKLAKHAEIKWKRNGLRHSWISYRVAQSKDVPQVALEAGNSARIIFTNYLEFVDEAEATKWFAIVPLNASTSVAPTTSDASPPTACA